MGSNATFLSVMTPATSAGTITFLLETIDYTATLTPSDRMSQSESLSVTLTVTGVVCTIDEVELATLIYEQISEAILAQTDLAYDGVMTTPDETTPGNFQVTNSEHVICLWSQALFKLSVVSNPTGCTLVLSEAPVLITLAEAKEIASVLSLSWRSDQGTTLTDAQIIKLLTLASADLVSKLRNNIVLTTYMKEFKGNNVLGIKLSPTPIIDYDQPSIRRKDSSADFATLDWGKWVYHLNHETGKFTFRKDEVIIDDGSPFYKDNVILISFIAGHTHIPDEIKKGVVDMARYLLNPRKMDIQELAGGSGKIKFGDKVSYLDRIFLSLKRYKAR